MDPHKLMNPSFPPEPWGGAIARIMAAALEAVEPGKATEKAIQQIPDTLIFDGAGNYSNRYRRVFVVGAGKAGAPMASKINSLLGSRLSDGTLDNGLVDEGIVIVKEGYSGGTVRYGNIKIVEAGHPIPDERGVRSTQEIFHLLKKTDPKDLVICLISGGGSALMTAPVEGVQLSDIQKLTATLLACGATIDEINTLRKHLDLVKGGGLARLASPATVLTLILSDVVGDPLDIIASGPTVPDPSTFQDAYRVLEHYQILNQIPNSILNHLRRGIAGEIDETPKTGDSLFDKVLNIVIGSNIQAAQAALIQAQTEGFASMLLTTFLQGEAQHAGHFLASIARQIARTNQPIPRPACIIAGGETTVTIKGNGMGGRNQEIALATVEDLAGLDQVALVTLATDGGDGPTNAAGAIVTGETDDRAIRLGLIPKDFLARNDSYHFFDQLDGLLKPGPTQTNVNDLVFIYAF
jgi:glycerate 2-kinase